MNQRTRETRYYKVNGAEEYSAMGSAEGQVQNLGYQATFPILLNISNEPTYFMALKDIDFIDMIRTCSRYRGYQSGVTYAEGFRPCTVYPRMTTKHLLP